MYALVTSHQCPSNILDFKNHYFLILDDLARVLAKSRIWDSYSNLIPSIITTVKFFSLTEVDEFDLAVRGQQNVVTFDISVHNLVVMKHEKSLRKQQTSSRDFTKQHFTSQPFFKAPTNCNITFIVSKQKQSLHQRLLRNYEVLNTAVAVKIDKACNINVVVILTLSVSLMT